jgi:hypothetical protein
VGRRITMIAERRCDGMSMGECECESVAAWRCAKLGVRFLLRLVFLIRLDDRCRALLHERLQLLRQLIECGVRLVLLQLVGKGSETCNGGTKGSSREDEKMDSRRTRESQQREKRVTGARSGRARKPGVDAVQIDLAMSIRAACGV